jgi:phenylpropionate dioxygenase-like ring-hydroxylating dioxygenase large terminal subunit
MALPPILAGQLASLRAQIAENAPCRGDAETHIPVDRYFSEAVWRSEVEALFRGLPLIVAHASELAPGQALAHDDYGIPLLLTRDADGRARAFLNVCRHRGMRLVAEGPARSCTGVACPYHGWAYRLDGELRHRLHADAFDACHPDDTSLVPLPCEERHGLLWVVPKAGAAIDVRQFLGGLDDEFAFHGIGELQHFRTIATEYEANWKLVVDAFLEAYHIRVLHKDTIYPYFADGLTAAQRFGPHISSLVARREAVEWVKRRDEAPATTEALRRIASPSHVVFPNTVTIFHPDYLSLITLYPVGPERLRWSHRMLVPRDKTTPDWTPHWEKTYELIEQGVFQKEDLHCAVQIQAGLRTGANRFLRAGRMEQGLAWFHGNVAEAIAQAST